MKNFAIVLGVVFAAAISSWEVGVATCNHLFVGQGAFDFVCGHNAPAQLLPSFILFLCLFSVIAKLAKRRFSSTKARTVMPSGNSQVRSRDP